MGKHISERWIRRSRLCVCVVTCLKRNKQSFSAISWHLEITVRVRLTWHAVWKPLNSVGAVEQEACAWPCVCLRECECLDSSSAAVSDHKETRRNGCECVCVSALILLEILGEMPPLEIRSDKVRTHYEGPHCSLKHDSSHQHLWQICICGSDPWQNPALHLDGLIQQAFQIKMMRSPEEDT